jgi:hypothetical protein
MKKIAALAVVLATGFGVLTPALAKDPPICLKTTGIDRTTVVNPQKILFRMKDGKTYSSQLSTPCIGLRFNGFVYDTSFMEVCGGSQSIRVLNTGEVCTLGKFEPVTVGQHG